MKTIDEVLTSLAALIIERGDRHPSYAYVNGVTLEQVAPGIPANDNLAGVVKSVLGTLRGAGTTGKTMRRSKRYKGDQLMDSVAALKAGANLTAFSNEYLLDEAEALHALDQVPIIQFGSGPLDLSIFLCLTAEAFTELASILAEASVLLTIVANEAGLAPVGVNLYAGQIYLENEAFYAAVNRMRDKPSSRKFRVARKPGLDNYRSEDFQS